MAALALEIDQRGAEKNVFFLFQHAEETGDGAAVCAELFQEERVDEIFGYHNRPGVPLGTVQVLDGTIYCASEGVILSYQGIPSHASMPEKGRNPAFAIAALIGQLGTLTDPKRWRGLVLATVIQVDVGARAFGTQASRGQLLLTIRGQYEEELELLRRRQYGHGMDGAAQVVDRASLEQMRQAAGNVHVSEEIMKYIISLVGATRKHPQLLQGASPRATLAVTAVSRAVAFLRGRDYVVPEDVQTIWVDAVAHRLLMVPGAERTTGSREIARAALQSVDPPRVQ